MTEIVFFNLLLAAIAAALPNDTLAVDSYILYGVQAALLLPHLLRRLHFVKNVFLPSFFVLVYSLVNFTLGSYLVPRGFGWNKNFGPVLLRIEHYQLIVPFLLLANLALFVVARSSLRQMARMEATVDPSTPESANLWSAGSLTKHVLCAGIFFVCAYADVYSAFSFELAVVVIALGDGALQKVNARYVLYAYYLAVAAAYDFDNKREIVMILFAVVFLEAYHRRVALRLTLSRVIACAAAACVFVMLVLSASILRGYGEYPVTTLVQGMSYIPQYVASDIFIDGLIDNLELNYSYGCTAASIEFAANGRLPYQYGGTLIKPLFLPVSREVMPIKPESAMRLFTNEYATAGWAANGSLPIAFASEAFLNFHYFGLLPYALVWVAVDRLFVALHRAESGLFAFVSRAFLCLTILMLARGSGLEQWILYYLVAAPVIGVAALVRGGASPSLSSASVSL